MEFVDDVNTWIQTHQELSLILGVLVALVVFLPWNKTDNWEWLDFIPHRRGRMLRKARREFVKQQAVDGFVSYVEDEVYHGRFTRDEAKEIYRDMKKTWPIRDLFPSPRLLKEAITRRLQSGMYQEPIPFPDKIKEAKAVRNIFEKAKKVRNIFDKK